MANLRLDKYLADMQAGTRSEVKAYIRKGCVLVNGVVVKNPEQKINTESDKVIFEGKIIGYQEYEYYMLNKPQGVVSATQDNNDTTVVELIKEKNRKDLFPVGRLDKDTEGLILITNDGVLAHELLSPKKHVDKTYFAKVKGMIGKKEVELFKNGIAIEKDYITLPAFLKVASADEKSSTSNVYVTIQEGKFHQVKRMFEAVGSEVLYLKRISMGKLMLDEKLSTGDYRKLSEQEIEMLKESTKRNG